MVLFSYSTTVAQEQDPTFIGDAFILKADNSKIELDKEFGDYTKGVSFSYNSWRALSLEVSGSKAKTRFSQDNKPLQLVVRTSDNNIDPLTTVSIYKLRSKRKVRSVVISEDNSWTLMKSRTHSKNMLHFGGKRYGTSSYIISLKNLEPGEYGIVVSSAKNTDQSKAVVSCFAIDK